ncbi:hypothetical protein QJS04_geneDACA005192 [Acorus gramineus]|uniref:Uncharacterized protein n=1 Tax=Acorus gramineus TaxID=55184 RepID=A0AAV9AYP8_ACOGR|nr:hypothetical protein QJS04_geneDACA005192 [Acorus gramineus]
MVGHGLAHGPDMGLHHHHHNKTRLRRHLVRRRGHRPEPVRPIPHHHRRGLGPHGGVLPGRSIAGGDGDDGPGPAGPMRVPEADRAIFRGRSREGPQAPAALQAEPRHPHQPRRRLRQYWLMCDEEFLLIDMEMRVVSIYICDSLWIWLV